MIKPNISPKSGFLLCIPFIEKGTFKPAKEDVGSIQKSKVIKVGTILIDDNGILRSPQCKIGDIILHKYVPDEFTISFDQYRFVHFADLRGIWLNSKDYE